MCGGAAAASNLNGAAFGHGKEYPKDGWEEGGKGVGVGKLKGNETQPSERLRESPIKTIGYNFSQCAVGGGRVEIFQQGRNKFYKS